MSDPPIIYTDDEDAHVDCRVNEQNGVTLDWADPMAAVGPGTYTIAAQWLGDPATTRWLRVPLSGLTARTAGYNIYLKVPGGSDIHLGLVYVRDRG